MQELTIRDIAKLADVSPATVSRVLNDFPYIKKTTKTRVLQVIAAHNYVPSAAAQGLRETSFHLIGILISDIRTTHHTDGIYYLERELSRHGYSCLIFNTGTDQEEQIRHIQQLRQRKVDAAVLMGSIYQTDAMKAAIEKYIPTIPVFMCNGYLDSPQVYGLIADEEHGVCDCVELLAKKGRRRLAFLVNHYTPSNRLKEKGFLTGVARFCAGVEPIVVETGTTVTDVYEATKKLMAEHPEVDGIVFSEDFLAVAGLRALTEAGIAVPEQVSVVGINNSSFARLCTPPITSLDNMLYDLSHTAAKNILSVLNGERVNRKMMIYSKIVERQST